MKCDFLVTSYVKNITANLFCYAWQIMSIIILFDPAKNVINPLQYEAILKIFVEEAYCYYIRLSTFSKIKKRF